MGITLAKAMQYCAPFATDDNREVFGYGYIDGDKIYATNTHVCIECTLNGDSGQQLMPLSKKALAAQRMRYPEEFSLPNYPRVLDYGADDYIGTIDLEKDTGIKPIVKQWKEAFSFCKKLAPKGEPARCMLESYKGSFYAYGMGENEVGAKFQLQDGDFKGTEFDPSNARGIFNADYMERICKVLIDLDPVKATLCIGKDFKKLMVKTDDMRIVLMGMVAGEADDPLVIYYEAERYLR